MDLQLELTLVFGGAGVGGAERLTWCGQRRVRHHERPQVRRHGHVEKSVWHHVAGRGHRGIRHLGGGRVRGRGGRPHRTERAVPVRPPDAGASRRRH